MTPKATGGAPLEEVHLKAFAMLKRTYPKLGDPRNAAPQDMAPDPRRPQVLRTAGATPQRWI